MGPLGIHYVAEPRHLPGKHNQKTHGGGGHGAAGLPSGIQKASRQELDDTVDRLQSKEPEKYWMVAKTHAGAKTFAITADDGSRKGYFALYEHDGGKTVEIGTLVAEPGARGVVADVMKATDSMYPDAVQKLDCFDGHLPKIYGKHGFEETGRVQWDDQYAPDAWKPEYGRPDVVFMTRAPASERRARANSGGHHYDARHLAGKHNQKTHGGGGQSKWTVEDREFLEKQAADQTWAWINSSEGAELRANHTQAELEVMVKEQVSLLVPPNPGVTLRNGDMSLHLTSGLSVPVTDQHKELLTRRMVELNAAAPVNGKVTVSIVPQANMSAENVRGMTQRGTGRIFLSEEIFKDGAQKVDPGFMPSYKDKGVIDYTLTHEWGHARDNLSDSASIAAWGKSMDGISEYGLFSPREAFAEAFAEWNLTGGKTDNPSARAYAERFGW